MRLVRDPLVLSAGLLAALVLGLPYSRPLFAALFPQIERPLYQADPFWLLLVQHLGLVAASSLAAALLGIGAAIFVTRPVGREFRSLLATLATLGQTFPPVAVLAIAVPAMGFGAEPALLALTLYGLLPILENSLTAFDQVPEAVREAGRGCGMSGFQLWRAVELPLAAPLILTGVRLSVTVNVGTAALASTVGAKSLGLPLIIGLNSANTAYVLQGALLVGALALTLDLALARLVQRADAWRRARPG